MVSNTEITNKGLEKTQLRYEQAKQKLAEEMAKAREKKRRAAIQSSECKNTIMKVKSECAGNGSKGQLSISEKNA